MKRTAITYARKSIKVRGQENERDSVLYQLNRINRYAEENGYEFIDSFSDIGYSGVLRSRPELNRMLEFLK
ncbi:recombinase family protein [Peribacillus tepidiphilus]|uniref:recombinase family protein n=1 Tax=Peribacillus tepidiphilus TaxID=2652445 RepID=UPI0035B5172E